MNPRLQNILEIIQQHTNLDADEKNRILKLLQDADKELEITTFKLDRTEKVKKTTAILLEETIEELEQKRKAVVTQNRNLEIEASLERVRTQAMSMRQSKDLLGICEILLAELKILGVTDIRNTQIAILVENEDFFINYQFSDYGVFGITEIYYKGYYLIENFVNKIKKGTDFFVLDELSGNELEEWKEFRIKNGDLVDPKLNEATALYYYWYSTSTGALGISTFKSITDEQLKILQRFRNVFDLAYRRFVDIQQAEAQAKEAQIQLALERVRARTMAMQKSNELCEVVSVVFEQLLQLGFPSDGCAIELYNKENLSTEYWITLPGNVLPQSFTVPYFDHPYYKEELDAWQKGVSYKAFVYEGELKKSFEEFVLNSSPLIHLPDDIKETLTANEKSVASIAFMEVGSLSVIGPDELSEAHAAILKRFTKTFDQTYTRFLDLKQAEAQARESQIQLALERVRARTMAMQRSDELANVATILFQQVKALGVSQWVCGFSIWEIGDKDCTWYPGSPDGDILTPCKIPLTEHPVFIQYDESRKRGDKLLVYEKEGEIQANHYRYMQSLPGLGELLQKFLDAGLQIPTFQIDHIANFSHGNLVFITYEHFPEMHDVFKRFAKVFEQTYTRFLDLQKAEEQAREAQIEAALERIRNRTLLMKESNELAEASVILFQQFKALDLLPPDARTYFSVINEKEQTAEVWMTQADGSERPGSFLMPLNTSEALRNMFEAWKRKDAIHIRDLSGDRLKEYIEVLKAIPSLREDQSYQQLFWSIPKRRVISEAIYLQGTIGIISDKPVSKDALETLVRFGKVFEFTYTRFLDLQKAEAQAREAQIELGLERVRAKAMAMQNSEELNKLIGTVFTELTKLNLVLTRCVIMIYDPKTNNARWWMANSEAPDQPMNFLVKYHEHPPNIAYFKAWQERAVKFEYVLEGLVKQEWDDFLFSETELSKLPDFVIAGMRAPDRVYLNASFNNFGNLTLAALDPLSNENFEILLRFAKVFDLTYTRFNDLKQAEAQAREAQIEAALERVRSRGIAMHKTDELLDAAELVYKELSALGIPSMNISYAFVDEEEKYASYYSLNPVDGKIPPVPFVFPHTETEVMLSMLSSWKKQEPFNVIELDEEATLKHQTYIGEHIQNLITKNNIGIPFSVEAFLAVSPKKAVIYSFNFTKGYLFYIGGLRLTPMQEALVLRFTKVFEQTYTRFLDLQKAEAQAKEATIEAALERVRAKAMAMHVTEDLAETIRVFYQQMELLGILARRCGVGLIDNETRTAELTSINLTQEGEFVELTGKLNLTKHPVLEKVYDSWLLQKEYHPVLRGKEITEYYQLIGSQISFQNYPHDAVQFGYFFFFTEGSVYVWTEKEFTEDELKLYRRFSSVLNLTYKRYKDLKKAEEQAREAQIEVSLERVRSKAMAMQKSDDLANAVAIVFEELDKLNLGMLRCGIGIVNKEKKSVDVWTTTKSDNDTVVQVSGDESMDIHPLLQGAFDAWINQRDHSYVLKGEDLNNYYKALTGVNFKLPDSQSLVTGAEGVQQYYFNAVFSAGGLFAFRETEFPEEAKIILKRFADVFHLTYTRFNDLKQAEAQAREAKIEAALERVRSKTMAMHNSKDVTSATETMFEELKKLGIDNLRCGIANIYLNKTFDVFGVTNLAGGNTMSGFGLFGMDEHPIWQRWFESWKNKEEVFIAYIAGQEKEEYFNNINNHRNYLPQKIVHFPDNFFQAYYFEQGSVWTYSLLQHSAPEKEIMKRFATGFSLTFRRYQDLKQAEAQAKEATIEAALEKVRGKAMAMHNSNDLSATASLVFTELRKLGIDPIRCGVSLQSKESRKNSLYYSIPSADGDNLSLAGSALLAGHPVLSEVYDSWIRGEAYFPVLKGELLTSYYQTLKQEGFDVPSSSTGHEQYGYYLPFSEGMFYGWSEEPYTESEIKILKRFASVIDLTFRRYMELQKSEANAKQAVKQAALDRIRADIASMRTTNDLETITPLIWNELTILGVPFIRCGVFIMDDSQQLIHTFLSTPDGKAIAAFHLPYTTPGNIAQVLSHWHDKKNYIAHWDESAFTEFAGTLVKQGTLITPEQYLKTIPRGGFHLHFLPFLQGMLYVGNTTQLGDDEIKLIQSVADAFSTAYARYEDFNKLESAKEQIEKTLVDLKQTQALLIQSEKMASLGELTAGIAHEIQNPLNFVNNFSEVSNELLDEMINELKNDNKEDAFNIAGNVKQNLEKILHHGKRADGIVKGMLLHSRSSSAVKEPTDINKLTDEYLRLAYHGLRAKDKSFNATLKTDFDESIGNINIIPQDIGRVLLNLYNNAFYAVTEKRKTPQPPKGGAEYEPTVSVSTKKINGKVEIRVVDNGMGIPTKILDKIFQPFFTAKPTGQGTGLGLSLSYDIVKAHGGEMKVETKEGAGAEFIILLPL